MSVETWWDSRKRHERDAALRAVDFTVNLASTYAQQEWSTLPWWVQRIIEHEYITHTNINHKSANGGRETMTKAQARAKERQDAITELREMVKPGDTLYTICRHVSRSGTSYKFSSVLCACSIMLSST